MKVEPEVITNARTPSGSKLAEIEPVGIVTFLIPPTAAEADKLESKFTSAQEAEATAYPDTEEDTDELNWLVE